MLKHLRVVAAILILALSLCACSNRGGEGSVPSSQAASYPYSFSDSNGNSVILEAEPQRVAVLFSSFADVWNLAGGEIAVTVGESVVRGFAPDGVPVVDSGAGKLIDTELLLSYEPDFVICSADIDAQTEAASLLRSVGIPCAEFRVESFDEYLSMLKICTDITGNAVAYRKYGTDVRKGIDKVLSLVPDGADAPQKKILFIRSGSSSSSAKAKTADEHFAAAMLEQLGAYNIADNAPVLLDGLSIEEILSEDPDEIFIATMGDEEAAKAYMDSVLGSNAWQALTAVGTGRTYYLPKDMFQYKPNARWDEAYRYLASLLYPEADFYG